VAGIITVLFLYRINCDDSKDEFKEDAVPTYQNCRTCKEEALQLSFSLSSGRYPWVFRTLFLRHSLSLPTILGVQPVTILVSGEQMREC